MSPPRNISEFRTTQDCEKRWEKRVVRGWYVIALFLSIFMGFVAIYARAHSLDLSREIKQEVEIGKLKTETNSVTNRLVRIEDKLDNLMAAIHKSQKP